MVHVDDSVQGHVSVPPHWCLEHNHIRHTFICACHSRSTNKSGASGVLWWPSGYTAVTILDHTTILTSGGIIFIPSSRQVDIQRGVVCARALNMLQLCSLPEAPVRSFKRVTGQNECSTTPPHTPQVACCAINGILGSKCTLTEVQGASTPPHMQH